MMCQSIMVQLSYLINWIQMCGFEVNSFNAQFDIVNVLETKIYSSVFQKIMWRELQSKKLNLIYENVIMQNIGKIDFDNIKNVDFEYYQN